MSLRYVKRTYFFSSQLHSVDWKPRVASLPRDLAACLLGQKEEGYQQDVHCHSVLPTVVRDIGVLLGVHSIFSLLLARTSR